MNEIINKVATSTLKVFDLEEYFPKQEIVNLDVAQWLFEGFILKEKEFRQQLKEYNWQHFQNRNIAINCWSDAILPSWAVLLVSSYLVPFAAKIVMGSTTDFLVQHYTQILASIDYSVYQNQAVILKGCSKKPVPENAYIVAIQKLQPVAKSIMYGEACSAVPIYKKSSTQ